MNEMSFSQAETCKDSPQAPLPWPRSVLVQNICLREIKWWGRADASLEDGRCQTDMIITPLVGLGWLRGLKQSVASAAGEGVDTW